MRGYAQAADAETLLAMRKDVMREAIADLMAVSAELDILAEGIAEGKVADADVLGLIADSIRIAADALDHLVEG